jgi:hypothetical protein
MSIDAPLPALDEHIEPLRCMPHSVLNARLEPMERAKLKLILAYTATSLYYASNIKSIPREQSSSLSIKSVSKEHNYHVAIMSTRSSERIPPIDRTQELFVPGVPMSDDSDPSAAISPRSSQCSEPQPLGSDRISVPAVPMSDQELLKDAFAATVRERRRSARSWMSDQDIELV